jgi:hypothetical protein
MIRRLFRKLLAGPLPTDTWRATPHLPLILDLERHTVVNIGPEASVEWLSVLGPPEDRDAIEDACYRYMSKGLEFWAEDHRIKDIRVVWNDPLSDPHMEPFPGTTRHRGRHVALSSSTTVSEFTVMMGEPYWIDRDPYETLLFYEFDHNVEWQVEFPHARGLGSLMITAFPLMAFPEQRERYGVTKPWPP